MNIDRLEKKSVLQIFKVYKTNLVGEGCGWRSEILNGSERYFENILSAISFLKEESRGAEKDPVVVGWIECAFFYEESIREILREDGEFDPKKLTLDDCCFSDIVFSTLGGEKQL